MDYSVKIIGVILGIGSWVALGASTDSIKDSPSSYNAALLKSGPRVEVNADELKTLQARLETVERENDVRKSGMCLRLFDHFLLAEAIYMALPYLGCPATADTCWGISRTNDVLFYACLSYGLVQGVRATWMGLKGEYPTDTWKRYKANRKHVKKSEILQTTV